MRGPNLPRAVLSILAIASIACEDVPPTDRPRGIAGGSLGAAFDAGDGEGRSREPLADEDEPDRPRRVATTVPATPAPASTSTAPATSRADELVRTVESVADPVVRCISQHGGGGDEVAVPVDFHVSATGHVTRAEVDAPSRSPLASCVRHAVESVRFPGGEATHFRYEYRVKREPPASSAPAASSRPD